MTDISRSSLFPMSTGHSPPAGPYRISDMCGAVIALACLLLLYGGRPAAAIAASDKPAAKRATDKAAADKEEPADEEMSAEEDETEDDAQPGFRLEKVKEIVVWNEHNGKHHDSGAETCNLDLLLDGKTVWERHDVEIPWEPNKSANCVIPVPNIQADKLRVEVTAWKEKGGGLAEVEVLDKTGTNLGFGGKVKTSADRSPGDQLGGAALIDGIYDSPTAEAGYWLLPESKAGWAEIELVPQKTPAPSKERKAIKKGKKQLSRTPMGAELFVACEESFDLYINGEHTLSGHGQRGFSRHISIANGDIVAVKCEGTSDTKGGFCIKILFPNGHYLSTWSNWGVFTPADPNNWFVPERIKPNAKIAKGTGWAENVLKEEAGHTKTPIPQIWGTGKTVYLAMQADTSVKKKKMTPPGKKKR